MFTRSNPDFNFLWVADVCWLSERDDAGYLMLEFSGLSVAVYVGVLTTGTLKLMGKDTEKSWRLKSIQLPPQMLTVEILVVN
ncbi:hypothetical protein CgunFtcFv8_005209 [Champsocephalus gunnari]|uniref:Uncharacterized protein n=1 Tax=Champsocephalus gunnari TaxID=52237 RepID=A0AAN8CVV3_CHAGU|nr:hypothetical protein CgunFtcFv8_005209 [Champsocephalus gunnari]